MKKIGFLFEPEDEERLMRQMKQQHYIEQAMDIFIDTLTAYFIIYITSQGTLFVLDMISNRRKRLLQELIEEQELLDRRNFKYQRQDGDPRQIQNSD